MPPTPLRACARGGCAALVRGHGYCNAHQTTTNRAKWRQRDETRAPSSERYGHRWAKLSRRFLAEHPLCAHCLLRGRTTAARHTDHIVPIEDDPSRRYDWDNLQALCPRCHRQKTQRDIARRRGLAGGVK